MQFNDDNENDATWLKRKEEALENLKNSIFRALRQNKKSLKTYDYLQDIKSYEKDKADVKRVCIKLGIEKDYLRFIRELKQIESEEIKVLFDEDGVLIEEAHSYGLNDYHSHDGGSLFDQYEHMKDNMD